MSNKVSSITFLLSIIPFDARTLQSQITCNHALGTTQVKPAYEMAATKSACVCSQLKVGKSLETL
jgi:hypothetical protein